MIITDETPTSPDKATMVTPLLGSPSASSMPPPPAYAPRESGPAPIGSAQAPYPGYQPPHLNERRSSRSAARRFCRAFLVAVVIWVLASALLGTILDNAGAIHDHWNYPAVPGVNADHCINSWPGGEKTNPNPAGFPFSVEASLDVPLPSETLLLYSQGSLSAGNLQITTSPEISGIARVHVVVHYYKKYIRDQALICMIGREKDELGVGIFSPQYRRDHIESRTDRLFFDVVLTLPRDTYPLYINRLLTNVNNFEQDVESLKDIINFGDLNLKGTNGRIHTKSVAAENATLTTTNGAISADYLVSWSTIARTRNAPITGTYKSAHSVDLGTTNARIDVQVDIDAGTSKDLKTISLQTTNDPLSANIGLSTKSGSGGNFRVKAATANGALTANVSSLPLNATLAVSGTTSNHAATLALPSTYEGDFDIRTTNAPLLVQRRNPHERDPASLGRKRTMQASTYKGKTVGNVYWDQKAARRGNVVLKTTNGVASLNL